EVTGGEALLDGENILELAADERAAKICTEVAKNLGYDLKEKSKLEAERACVRTLTGLVKGAAAKRDFKVLERFLNYEKARNLIPGRFEIYQIADVARSGNKLLRLKADEAALDRLAEIDFEIHLGASGRVKLSIEQEGTKVDALSRKLRLKELEKQIADQKEKVLEMQRER
ncbi:MAG: hypothetical protein AAFS07_19535, partial [Pseudomonadota bacterium]